MHFEGVSAQIVDLPAINSKNFDIGLLHTADLILIVVSKLEDYFSIDKSLERASNKRILVLTHIDLLDSHESRKLEAQLKSKRLNYILVSGKTNLGIKELKKKIFENMNVIRVFTKEPGKPVSTIPIVKPIGSTVKDIAESIYKGFSKQISETRLTGPSGKFANQRVGLDHTLKDRDVLEFKTR